MIRKFLLKCLVFCFVAVTAALTLLAALNSLRPRMFDIGDADTVYLGNSHIETAVNDSIVSGAVNFGRSAEVSEYIYCKIKLLNHYNPGLTTVVVGFDPNLMWHEGSEHTLMHPTFIDMLTPRDWSMIISKGSYRDITHHLSRPFDVFKLLEYAKSILDKENGIKNSTGIGGFIYLKRDRLQRAIELSDKDSIEAPAEPNPVGAYFMDRIYDYCKGHGLRLIFLCPPQHKLSKSSRVFVDIASERYPDIKFLNFIDMPLPDSCFADLDHLNYRGAKTFSEFLETEIINNPASYEAITDSIN